MSDIFGTRATFKPMSYPWAYEAFTRQSQIHWTKDEVPLHEDVRDWNSDKMSDSERNLLTQIFRFFTQGDIDVAEGYYDKYIPMFHLPELRMMLGSFAAMEATHIDAYANLLETVGMPESEYLAFREIEEMAEKHLFVTEGAADMVKGFTKDQKTAFDIATFSAFTEGLHLFSSFIILLNFSRFGKMKGMGQIVTWSIRDESLHVEAMIKLFNTIVDENPKIWTVGFRDKLANLCRKMVEIEFAFIDKAFEFGAIEGLTPVEVKEYVRYIADRRMLQLGAEPLFSVKRNPLPWVAELLNGVEHANFFESRATEYSKGALKGSWEDVWGV